MTDLMEMVKAFEDLTNSQHTRPVLIRTSQDMTPLNSGRNPIIYIQQFLSTYRYLQHPRSRGVVFWRSWVIFEGQKVTLNFMALPLVVGTVEIMRSSSMLDFLSLDNSD
jgi:hypothetical protein